MGMYLNPGANKFRMSLNSEIYVDKTGLLAFLNRVLCTDQRFVCVSRPRRFGKTMAANMVSAYYDRTVDGAQLFHGLTIAADASFDQQRNQYDVLHLNMQEFLSRTQDMQGLLDRLQRIVLRDLLRAYPDIDYFDQTDLVETLNDIYVSTARPFVIIIDEWDCVFRESRNDRAAQEQYLDFLRDFLKDKSYVALAYMTGILPIKKYGTHSALNMFDEYTMTNPGQLAQYVGFTTAEVQQLCAQHNMDFQQMKQWYDGYYFPRVGEIYSPRSVTTAIRWQQYGPYWNQTETFEALRIYIDLNMAGLRDAVIQLMAGERLPIDTGTFSNDMTTFHTADDVLTLLIHLGYLAYDEQSRQVYIPNKEVMLEFVNATSVGGWEEIAKSIKASQALLEATWRGDEVAVAAGVEAAHFETSQLTYNSENALSYTLSLAYYAAREYYTCYRELPTGKGFADLVFIPRPHHADKPAMVIELKWNQDAETALRQIEEKKYPRSLTDYAGRMLLVGVSYEQKSKKHSCRIVVLDK